jgi:hypothetical protein
MSLVAHHAGDVGYRIEPAGRPANGQSEVALARMRSRSRRRASRNEREKVWKSRDSRHCVSGNEVRER